jgi:hypothetical protein
MKQSLQLYLPEAYIGQSCSEGRRRSQKDDLVAQARRVQALYKVAQAGIVAASKEDHVACLDKEEQMACGRRTR